MSGHEKCQDVNGFEMLTVPRCQQRQDVGTTAPTTRFFQTQYLVQNTDYDTVALQFPIVFCYLIPFKSKLHIFFDY
jgi:hypothetical protein